MSIKIEGYEFEGPFASTDYLKNSSGVYVIHYKDNDDEYQRLDVGESDDVKDRVETHNRKECWIKNANEKTITASAYYCNNNERMIVEKKIRGNSDLPCGEI
jgi:predicted GIY-YIG superfamily endonuclease